MRYLTMPDPSAHDVLLSLAEHWELQQFALSHSKEEIAVAMAAAFGACGALARSVAEEHAQARREAEAASSDAGPIERVYGCLSAALAVEAGARALAALGSEGPVRVTDADRMWSRTVLEAAAKTSTEEED
jgi:predicted protein tyrosine phosphatase